MGVISSVLKSQVGITSENIDLSASSNYDPNNYASPDNFSLQIDFSYNRHNAALVNSSWGPGKQLLAKALDATLLKLL